MKVMDLKDFLDDKLDFEIDDNELLNFFLKHEDIKEIVSEKQLNNMSRIGFGSIGIQDNSSWSYTLKKFFTKNQVVDELLQNNKIAFGEITDLSVEFLTRELFNLYYQNFSKWFDIDVTLDALARGKEQAFNKYIELDEGGIEGDFVIQSKLNIIRSLERRYNACELVEYLIDTNNKRFKEMVLESQLEHLKENDFPSNSKIDLIKWKISIDMSCSWSRWADLMYKQYFDKLINCNDVTKFIDNLEYQRGIRIDYLFYSNNLSRFEVLVDTEMTSREYKLEYNSDNINDIRVDDDDEEEAILFFSKTLENNFNQEDLLAYVKENDFRNILEQIDEQKNELESEREIFDNRKIVVASKRDWKKLGKEVYDKYIVEVIDNPESTITNTREYIDDFYFSMKDLDLFCKNFSEQFECRFS